MSRAPYTGRFAPSPTGPLHLGSLVAALASWLDARVHQGQWLIRIEDVDTPRCHPQHAFEQLQTLAAFGLQSDQAPLWQSQRFSQYQAALDQLQLQARVYPCGCSRRDVGDVYAGTCRPENGGLQGKPARAWRMRADGVVHWFDRRLGWQQQDLTQAVGDFVLKRADGLWAYQLAVVVDDAAQGITDVVRGDDLIDSTARQIHLQKALGVATPRYLHIPVVLAADGLKLSKQNGAQAIAPDLKHFVQAGTHLGLDLRQAKDLTQAKSRAVSQWAEIISRLP
jgi:glutamyl-Q tRNA(Asp) synthetase